MPSDSDRDASVEHLLRESRQARGKPASQESCLDAETLAAWADGRLSRADFAAAEAHLSDCSRCQALLASFAKTTPPAPQPWWRRGLTVRWLVPLTAAATAIAVWVVVPRREPARVPVLEDGRQQMIVSPKSQESAPAPVEQSSSAAVVGGELGTRRDEPLSEAKDRLAAPPAVEREARKDSAPLGQERAAAENAVRIGEGTRALSPPPVAPPATAQADSALDKTVQLSRQASVAANAVEIEIVSPDPSTRWRVGASGVVERSTNGGSSWVAQSTGVAADLTAGVSPSPQVCWLVGRAGTVLLTSDGLNWQRVRFPETIDLMAVRASDARTATVTAADGRRFSTADGGTTWAPVQGF